MATGQFLRPSVEIDTESGLLRFGTEREPVLVQPGLVWDSVQDVTYQDRTCWYPQDMEAVLEGGAYDYVTEHILAHKYLHSLFDPRSASL